MADYNALLLRKYANRLYSQSYLVIVLYTVIAGLLGFGAGCLRLAFLRDENVANGVMLFAALIGLMLGLERSFNLRVKAQLVLCQVAIEENTRRSQNKKGLDISDEFQTMDSRILKI